MSHRFKSYLETFIIYLSKTFPEYSEDFNLFIAKYNDTIINQYCTLIKPIYNKMCNKKIGDYGKTDILIINTNPKRVKTQVIIDKVRNRDEEWLTQKYGENECATIMKHLYTEELPAGWDSAKTEKGYTYYIDHITKNTQWEKPDPPTSVKLVALKLSKNEEKHYRNIYNLKYKQIQLYMIIGVIYNI